MTLIKSISGIRGTIGGNPGDNLTPIDIVECVSGYGFWLRDQHERITVVVGRDARISGEIVANLAINTLISIGINVIDLGLSTTPTVEMAVTRHSAQGGIIFTASHNPKQWNALKFLNEKGEFISAEAGQTILKSIENKAWQFADIDAIGTVYKDDEAISEHIQSIIALDYVLTDEIKKQKFHIVVDCINSTGALALPALLKSLGCSYTLINEQMNGEFAHNPEPLPQHLDQLCKKVVDEKADLGIAVDPDVDRLAFVDEKGVFIGEEYTLVLVADYLLPHLKGGAVSNLSSSRALRDIAKKHDCSYHAAAVGEVNVVTTMKENNATIGGEGNGGIILPDLHYGRDAVVGVALALSKLVESGKTLSQLKAIYPEYTIIKNKISLTPEIDVDVIINTLKTLFSQEELNTSDGLKIDFAEGWVHLRKSNTEPIIRVYAESSTSEKAHELAQKIMDHVQHIIQK